jgi:RHS repeat-associated protein
MQGNGYYAPNTLHKVTVTDPDGRVSKSFTDRKGRKVFTLNVQNNVAGGHYMIYSFDDKDRINKVFTPRNAWQEWWYTNELDYSYVYDWNDNVIQKKLPDIAAMNMKYNDRNQLVLMQDGKQAGLGQWLATQYDDYGRPSATGFATSTALNATTYNPTFSGTPLTSTAYSAVAGASLGKPIQTVNNFGTYLESVLQYDNYGRLASTYSNNQMFTPAGLLTANNCSEKTVLSYDLADNVLTKTRTHKPNATTTRTIIETMDYDNGLRLKQMKHQLDAMPEQILSFSDYNVKNQLITKRMGKTGALPYLQKVDYSYNTLGWLTGINSPAPVMGLTSPLSVCGFPKSTAPSTTNLDFNDLFSMDLKYEAPVAAWSPTGTATPQYGGNISQVGWQVRGREKQAYTLTYDVENRLTEAAYSDINAAGTVTGNRYDEKLTYDMRGNINTLQRWGLNGACTWGMIDNLSYNYGSYGYNISNKLSSVTDYSDLTRGFKTIANGSAYSYDNNGNMTADPNKGITSILYNHLNLPQTINFTGGNTINFLYDAGGNKLRKTVSGSVNYVQDYVGGIEYRGSVLEAIHHAEGRVTTINGVLKYEYALKDHLGNTRLMFCDKNNNGLITQSSSQEASEVTQENHYYPFGMSMEGTWSNTPSVTDSKYLYNGKEMNDDFGLGLMDYGARMYDAAIGRWHAVDPMAEKYLSSSSYNYVLGNPIKYFDPDGMQVKYDWAAHDRGDKGVYTDDETKKDVSWEETKRGIDANAKSSRTLKIYYTNDTDPVMSNEEKLSDNQAASALVEAMFILNQNIGVNSFTPQKISVSFAKKHLTTKPDELFIALINHGNMIPGLTNTQTPNVIGVFQNNYWSTYANAFFAKGNMYKMGYVIAHELLHQLTHYSGFGATHNNTKPYNLSTEGPIVSPFLKSSRNTGTTPRATETIPADQLISIKKYLGL